MTPETRKIFRDYAWAYFTLHAGQRLQSFNFFLVAAGLLTAGITGLLKEGGPAHGIAALLGGALSILSVVFWKLEQRTKYLVKNAEAALKHLDSQEDDLADEKGAPHVLKLFDHDDHVVKERLWHLSYTNCLGLVYLIFFLLGIIFLLTALLCR
jgi:hypothetical protein